MNLICAVCGIEKPEKEETCSECGSKKFLRREPAEDYLSQGHVLSSKYKIIDFIKSGGMGAVYKARDLNEKKLYAVKEVVNPRPQEETSDAVSRFKREAEILSKLTHPSLPHIEDYFFIRNRYYLVMDYIEGEDLEEILKKEGVLAEEKVKEWAIQICDVLDYLHKKDPPVIYRDIKPSNIMVKNDGKIMLIDFGIARTITPEEKEYTMTAIGTIGYVSPEQYKGKPEPKSDIYSLGVTMYKLLTGKMPLPFSLKPVKKLRPDISPELEAIVMKAVRIKASERFRNAQEMKNALLGNIVIVETPPKEEKTKTDLLLEELDSGDANLRYIVVRALNKHMEDVKILNRLIDLFKKEEDFTVKREIAALLSKIKDKNLIDLFNNAMEDEDAEIRLIAIDAVERFRDPSSIGPLIKALSWGEPQTSLKAARVLIDLKEKKALPELFNLLKKQVESETREELIKGIDRIDPLYLIEWKKTNSTKKLSNNIMVIFIFAILLLISYILYSNHQKSQNFQRLLNEGIKELDLHNYDLALDCFSGALKVSPDSPEVLYLTGKTYIYIDPVKAKVYLDKAIKLKSDYPEAITAEGILYLRNNDFKNAEDYFRKALDIKGEDPETYFYLGITYYREKRKKEAEEMFNRAMSVSGNKKISNFAGRWIKKINSEKIPPEADGEIRSILNRGESLIDTSDYSSASKEFEYIIKKYPDDARGYLGMGKIYLHNKAHLSAIQYFSSAIERDPMCMEAYYTIASLYMENSDYNEGLQYLGEADYFNPNEPDTGYFLGLIYYKSGNKEKALKELKKYLNLSPDGKHAKEAEEIIKKIPQE